MRLKMETSMKMENWLQETIEGLTIHKQLQATE